MHTHHWISNKTVTKASLVNEVELIPSSHAGLKQPTWWESGKQSRIPVRSHSKSSRHAPQPIRRQHRPTVAVHGDWDSALREAIAASYSTRKHMPAATPAEWDAALQEAILASRLVRRTATKQEWQSALDEAVSQSAKLEAEAAEDAKRLRRQQIKHISVQRRLSRSDSGGRRGRKDEALERQPSVKTETRGLAKVHAPAHAHGPHLWVKKVEPASPATGMWAPRPKTITHLEPESELLSSDAESEALRRKHKDQRSAGLDLALPPFQYESLGLAFGGLWSRIDGDEMRHKRSGSRGADRDWLAFRRTNRVQFRY
jgi:hypothetical protein